MMDHSADRLTDEILVLRAQDGDEIAFSQLVERWQTRLWGHARRLIRDDDGAWDVVQASLMAVARQLMSLEHVQAFPAWVYRITTGKCMDWLRARQRHRELEKRWTEEVSAASRSMSASPQTQIAVHEALATLSDTDRVLADLRWREGFSTRETAQILGIPEGTVKSRLSAVRAQLQSSLKGE
jgi:RNA polymerase sigma-70 factor, ECF subfamily